MNRRQLAAALSATITIIRNQPVKVAFGTVLGALPGALLIYFLDHQIGLAVGILGAIVGFALGLPGVSIQRVLLALFGIAFDRVAPPAQDLIDLDSADESIPVKDEDLSIHLLRWLVMPSVKQRRGWLVLAGVATGGLFGLSIGLRDVWLWYRNRPVILPPIGNIESVGDIFAQLIIVMFACSVWGGTLAALFASPPWRRSILFASGFGAFLSGMIAVAVSQPGEYRWDLMIPFATISAAFALFFFPLVDMQIFTRD